MLHRLRALVDAVAPWLPPVLVPPESLARIEDLSARLPAAFGWAVCECRLGPGDDRVDFLVCASARDGGRERLAATSPEEAARAGLGRVWPFVDEWCREGSLVNEDVPLLWFEHDLPPGPAPDPMIFIFVDPAYPSAAVPSPSALEVRELGARGLSLATGRKLPAATLDTLARCVARLPEDGRPLALCGLSPRGSDEIRLYAAMPAARIRGWLHAIGWPGNLDDAERAVELTDAGEYPTGVNVNVGPAVGPYFGAERYLHFGPDHAAAVRRLVEDLIDLGACDPDKGEAALGWPGYVKVNLPGAGWLVRVERHLNFKVVCRPDGALEAKAYLAFASRFTLL